MMYDGLTGIVKLDKKVKFYSVTNPSEVKGSMSLRHVLYNHLKLADGHSLIGEVHQENPLSSMDVVIPNTPEAEAMVAMMNTQLAAYLHHYLQ